MDVKEKSTTATSMKPLSEEPCRSLHTRMIQNFLVVWLDESVDEVNNVRHYSSMEKLRQVVNIVYTFTNVDECIDFITDIMEEKIFIVVSGALSQIIAPLVQNIVQVGCVYIFCENAAEYKQWIPQWPKVKGVFTDITPISEALQYVAHVSDQNSVNISFIKSDVALSKENLDELDQSFMYTQILKEILLTINFEQEHINDFLTYCLEEPIRHTIGLKNVEKFVKEYHQHQPIWWYSSQGFLYPMLNRALRTMEVDLIIKLGFFLRDLHQHITTLHSAQYVRENHTNSFTVYRGQSLSQTDFNQLIKTEGGLISFNNFLSTSLDRAVSLMFAETNPFDADLVGVLFEITIDPSISFTSFANIRNISAHQTEEEILFSMHSVFRLGKIKQTDEDNCIWQVELTLTNDNDPQLHALTEYIREETFSKYGGWHRLGILLIKLGHFKKAEILYGILLKQTTNEFETAHLFGQLSQVKYFQGEYQETITFSKVSIAILQKTLSPDHPDVISSLNNIGGVYYQMGEFSKALPYYEKALEIKQRTLPSNHPSLATCYNNIGLIYDETGDYLKALSFLKNALDIDQKILPSNHPSLATSYNNIGLIYNKIGNYSQALSYYKKVLEIEKKALPPDHPSLATSHNNIGLVYNNMAEYSKALSYFEKAFDIEQKTLPANHPSLATSHNNIGLVYKLVGAYTKALSHYEKALEIEQKILPSNHPRLAATHNNIGSLYSNMGDYSKALSYYEKTLHPFHETLPSNHPSLATSHNNIGLVYDKMGQYLRALSYYEKVLEIDKKNLPPDHPHVATTNNNIGLVYSKLSECSKALSYYEKALAIRQKTLPANHPDVAFSHSNIALVYEKLGDYSKALSYYKKAFEIFEKILPSTHPDLLTLQENIETVKKKLW